jgi:hypothetical protein
VVKRVPRLPTGTVEVDRVVELLRQSLHEAIDKIEDVEKRLGLPPVEDWQGVSFLNGWTQHPAAGYEQAGYYKDPYGRVHLRGLISPGTVGAVALNLPKGYRPSATWNQAVLSQDTGGTRYLSRLHVLSNGDVVTFTGGSPNWWWSLSGVSFRAEG